MTIRIKALAFVAAFLLSVISAAAATITVPQGGDLQAALNAAQPGDVIEMPAGARFVGSYKLSAKAGVVTFRTAGVLPNRRIAPGDASLLATIFSGGTFMAIDGTGAKNWRIDGVRFEPNVGGFGEVIGLQGADNVVLDRILLVVPEDAQLKRGITANGTRITLTRSYLSGIWRDGQDSQAFAAWDGAGPYTLTDNYLEAASENILFGGATISSAAHVPADILIEGNHLSKPLAWKGQKRQVKCLLELKAAKRVTIRFNVFERNWTDAQAGRAIVITPRNQDGDSPWAVIEDVLFEKNVVRETERGFNITGFDNLNASGQTKRITIRDNYIETTNGQAFLIAGEVGWLAIYRNQVVIPPSSVLLSLGLGQVWPTGATASRPAAWSALSLIFAENIAPTGAYIHSSTALNDAALKTYAQSYTTTVPK